MMSAKGTSSAGAAAGGLINRFAPAAAPAAAAVAGGAKLNEAGTILLVDVRSTVQVSAAEGYSKNWDFGLGTSVFAGLGAGAGSAYTNTP